MGSSLNLHVTNSPNIMFNLWEVGLLGIVMTWICDLWFLCSLFHMRLPVFGISRCSVSVFEDVILYIGHLILGRNSCCYPPNHDQGSTAGWQSAARGVTTTCFMCIHRITVRFTPRINTSGYHNRESMHYEQLVNAPLPHACLCFLKRPR